LFRHHGGFRPLPYAVSHAVLGDVTAPMPDTPILQAVPEDWTTGLCIVAHPDDIEYGGSAAVARWTSQGKKISYVLLTSGEAGIDGMAPEQAGPLREEEERRSAAVVGVDTVEFLGFADGVLEYGLPMRKAIAAAVRRHRPEIVMTGNFRESFGPGMLNQRDHIAAGWAVLDGVRDAANRWIFRELLDAGLEPWGGVRAVLAGGSPDGTHGVDTTDFLDKGIASLEEHRAYIDGLGQPDFDIAEFLESFARMGGARLGTKFAATFEVFPFGPF
jgi:LmbE family N-acetylglucosaminyl deacetylase